MIFNIFSTGVSVFKFSEFGPLTYSQNHHISWDYLIVLDLELSFVYIIAVD